MAYSLEDRAFQRKLTRRDFIWLSTVAAAGSMTGCAKNPVTGDSQLMLMSEAEEIQVDQEQAPHQFSADYGAVQDNALNTYITTVGNSMTQSSHRPHMPYSFRAVNATYVNAYTFPAGSIATTRGILLEMDNEAELAALLGHEIGHVNARHAAERQTKGLLASAVVAGASLATQYSKYNEYAALVQGIGGFASGALLAKYSRDNERQADSLGMEYMSRAKQNPNGMTGLMEVLVNKSQAKPNALEAMFSSHPMSQDRYDTAKQRAASQYGSLLVLPDNRERYMDNIAKLRAMKPVVDKLQDGEAQLKQEKFHDAKNSFARALRKAPRDYAALVLMSKCQLALDKPKTARHYAQKAQHIYPTEAQGHHLNGISQLAMGKSADAYQAFKRYEQLLPGNPSTLFLQGVSLEGMQQKQAAAEVYNRYLKSVKQGDQAQHAYSRLQAWGYVR
ncbi:M48 family metalloprotease [Candidatus Venteria ishoeyi]|uniref:TPR repeat-containing protein YfgC n=1 Tax=Candidatus Venteria ishoeyi TaxID=1899563 RepID=A0A1H6FA07_9GAMM|nr:M48 family metalloprotease [Candidatus Venteria ishoeyi]SEH06932.1 TPR repeat-containing protein YfgC precursor [Candidatus Venteria ishoeyi]